MFKIHNKFILNFIFFFSLLALISAYFIEYVLGHQPCNLCIIERFPYVIAIIIITLNTFFNNYQKITFILLSLIFFSATLISFYHFGIEKGFFEESLVCDLDTSTKILSKADILNELNKKTISCKIVTFKVLGFSLATLNTIISFVLSAITLKAFLNYGKNRQK